MGSTGARRAFIGTSNLRGRGGGAARPSDRCPYVQRLPRSSGAIRTELVGTMRGRHCGGKCQVAVWQGVRGRHRGGGTGTRRAGGPSVVLTVRRPSASASSAESVGEFWFGQVAKCVIQSDFQCPGGAEPIRPFGDHSGLSVEAFDNATGELPPGSEPVQNQVAVRAQPCGQPPSSGRAASASSGCTSGRGTGRPSTATRSPTAIESPP